MSINPRVLCEWIERHRLKMSGWFFFYEGFIRKCRRDGIRSSNYEKSSLEKTWYARACKEARLGTRRIVLSLERTKLVKDESSFFYKLRELLKLAGTEIRNSA